MTEYRIIFVDNSRHDVTDTTVRGANTIEHALIGALEQAHYKFSDPIIVVPTYIH